jgi:hypothetical protein
MLHHSCTHRHTPLHKYMLPLSLMCIHTLTHSHTHTLTHLQSVVFFRAAVEEHATQSQKHT